MSETQKLFLDEAGLNELVDRTRTETDSKINSAINTHNSSSDSHSDIRNSLNEAKEKLDTIEEGANRYTLPKATGSTLGGVIVGNNVQVSNGTISVPEASTTEPGVMSPSDKSKLDGITASADSVSFSRSLSSGTKIGTITINGTGTDLYCETNTDTNTHYTTRLYAGASGTAANAAATSPYIKVTDDNTYRNQIRLIGSGATTVTSDANGNITISSTDNNTTYTLSSFGITATATELNYCDGVTSNIQTQLNGKAASSHGTHVTYGTNAPKANGTASAGSASTVSRSDHVHPLQPLSVRTVPAIGEKTLSHSGTFTAVTGMSVNGTTNELEPEYTMFTLPSDNNTDTKNTAGSTNSTSKLFLIGATSQSANPQTYSNSGVYVDAFSCLHAPHIACDGALAVGGHTVVDNQMEVSGRVVFKNAFYLGDSDDATNSIFLKMYPVGSIYMSVSSTNPSTYFGGTWEAWGSGRVPVGVNTSDANFSTVEKTGGASSVTLTTDQIPSHTHTFTGSAVTSGTQSANHTHTSYYYAGNSRAASGSARDTCVSPNYTTSEKTKYSTTTSANSANHTHSVTAAGSNSNTGGGGAHTNLQPYITCYMWKRTA